MMPLTADQWATVLGRLGVRRSTAALWAYVLSNGIGADTFSDPRDLPNFLAQCAHESAGFERLEESLYYTAPNLCRVWPRRFPTLDSARAYAANPQALAGKVYDGRMGNNAPGDGWKYRGRGLIQITGADNYAAMESLTGLPLLDDPDLLLEPENALAASISWWEAEVSDADLGSVESVTRTVNGGTTGLAERRGLTNAAKAALGDMESA